MQIGNNSNSIKSVRIDRTLISFQASIREAMLALPVIQTSLPLARKTVILVEDLAPQLVIENFRQLSIKSSFSCPTAILHLLKSQIELTLNIQRALVDCLLLGQRLSALKISLPSVSKTHIGSCQMMQVIDP